MWYRCKVDTESCEGTGTYLSKANFPMLHIGFWRGISPSNVQLR